MPRRPLSGRLSPAALRTDLSARSQGLTHSATVGDASGRENETWAAGLLTHAQAQPLRATLNLPSGTLLEAAPDRSLKQTISGVSLAPRMTLRSPSRPFPRYVLTAPAIRGKKAEKGAPSRNTSKLHPPKWWSGRPPGPVCLQGLSSRPRLSVPPTIRHTGTAALSPKSRFHGLESLLASP